MAMFDAKQLWWPPLPRFYALLAETSAKDADADAKAVEVGISMAVMNHSTRLLNYIEPITGVQDRLKEYNQILLHGIGFFKPQTASSRTAVETEPSLGIDKKKIPINAELRSLALDLSGYLVGIQILM